MPCDEAHGVGGRALVDSDGGGGKDVLDGGVGEHVEGSDDADASMRARGRLRWGRSTSPAIWVTSLQPS